MIKKRFLLGLAMSSIVLVSLVISSFTIMTSPFVSQFPGGFHQQRISLSGSIPASNTYRLDCFRRHYSFTQEKSSLSLHDASNYFLSLS